MDTQGPAITYVTSHRYQFLLSYRKVYTILNIPQQSQSYSFQMLRTPFIPFVHHHLISGTYKLHIVAYNHLIP